MASSTFEVDLNDAHRAEANARACLQLLHRTLVWFEIDLDTAIYVTQHRRTPAPTSPTASSTPAAAPSSDDRE